MSDQRGPGTQSQHQECPHQFSRALEVEGPTIKTEGLPAPSRGASLGIEHLTGPEHHESLTTFTLDKWALEAAVLPDRVSD